MKMKTHASKSLECIRAVLRRKLIAIQAYLKKQEKSQTNLTPKEAGTRRTNKTQTSKRKEIIKIRAEINEIEASKQKQQINETRSWFFENSNKTDTPLARFIKKERKRKKEDSNKIVGCLGGVVS